MPIQTQDASGAAAIDYDGWRRRIREHTFSHYHTEMGRAILREGNLAAAEAAFRRALEIRPDTAGAAFGLCEALRALGRGAEAAEVDARTRLLNPGYNAEVTLERAEALFARKPADGAPDPTNEALERINDALREAPQLAPRAATLLKEIAKIQARNLGEEKALRVCERALAMVPGSGELLGAYAEYVIALKRVVEAETACRRADRLGGEEPEDRNRRRLGFANLLMWNDRMQQAAAVLNLAVEERPDDVATLVRLGQLYVMLGRHDAAEAVLARAAAQEPDAPSLRPALATLRLANGAVAEAVRIQAEVCRDAPDNAVLLATLGLMRIANGETAMALETLRHAVGMAADNQWCATNLGLAVQAAGDVDEAAAIHRRALGDGDDSWTATNLGLALWALGRAAEAEEAFRRATRGMPSMLPYQARLRPWAYDLLRERFAAIGVAV